MQLIFQFRNSTKGAHRYEEVDNNGRVLTIAHGAKIGTLYIRRTAMPTQSPLLAINITEMEKEDPQ